MILLQGALACLLTGREIRARPAFAHERPAFLRGVPFG
jgi:hypothetical protein